MELHELVFKEGSTSPKMIKIGKGVEIFAEMIFWGEVHEKLENPKMTHISEVDEFIFQLNKENERANIVRKEEKNGLRKYLEGYVLKLPFEHNYYFLGKDGGKNHQPIRC